jgi:hypothetical protein
MKNAKAEIVEIVSKINPDLVSHVDLLNIDKACFQCGHFNKNLKDVDVYRCYNIGTCISATLHPEITDKIWSEYTENFWKDVDCGII